MRTTDPIGAELLRRAYLEGIRELPAEIQAHLRRCILNPETCFVCALAMERVERMFRDCAAAAMRAEKGLRVTP